MEVELNLEVYCDGSFRNNDQVFLTKMVESPVLPEVGTRLDHVVIDKVQLMTVNGRLVPEVWLKPVQLGYHKTFDGSEETTQEKDAHVLEYFGFPDQKWSGIGARFRNGFKLCGMAVECASKVTVVGPYPRIRLLTDDDWPNDEDKGCTGLWFYLYLPGYRFFCSAPEAMAYATYCREFGIELHGRDELTRRVLGYCKEEAKHA